MGFSKRVFEDHQQMNQSYAGDEYYYSPKSAKEFTAHYTSEEAVDKYRDEYFSLDTDEDRTAFLSKHAIQAELEVKAGHHWGLYMLQFIHAMKTGAPMFYRAYTSGTDREPTSKYMLEHWGVERALKRCRDELVTGCPKSSWTWCD